RHFRWPIPDGRPPTVGESLLDLMGADGWPGAASWAERAAGIGPTLVGGSRKHGGPDLGPTRAREAWLRLGVDGKGLADAPPGPVPAFGEDLALDAVQAELERCDPTGDRVAGVLRDTLDQLYDGQHTGRYSYDDLRKTEKTHMGTLVEINLQNRFEFGDGDVT